MFIDDYVSALKRLHVDVKNGIDIGFVEVCVRGIKLPECIAILDIETTGLNEVFDEIVSYGVVRDFDGVVKARVVVRIESDENTLLEHLKSDLKDLKVVYAYYKDFEERFFSASLQQAASRSELSPELISLQCQLLQRAIAELPPHQRNCQGLTARLDQLLWIGMKIISKARGTI